MSSCKGTDIIYQVKKYLANKDIEGLKQYIEKEEENVKKCNILSKNETAEYIDTLTKELN